MYSTILKYKHISFIILLLCCAHSIKAQYYQEEVQRLRAELKANPVDDERKVDLLNRLCYIYTRNEPSKIDSVARLALTISKQLNYTKGESIALKNIGNSYTQLGQSVDSAIVYYSKSFELAKVANDYFTQTACLNNLGISYTTKTEYLTALKSFQEALAIHKQYLTLNTMRLLVMGNIGETYIDMEDYKQANIYLEETIRLSEQENHLNITVMFIDDYALVQEKLGKSQKAINKIQSYLPQTKQLGDYFSFVKTSALLSKILIEAKQYDTATSYIEEAITLAKKHNFNTEYCDLLLYKSTIALAKNHAQEAITYAELAYEYALKMNSSLQKLQATQLQLEGSLLSNDQDKLSTLLSQYEDIFASNYEMEQKKIRARLEAEYQTIKKDAENKILRTEQNRNEITIQSQRTMVSALVILGGLFTFLSIFIFRIKKSQQALLEQSVQERTNELSEAHLNLEKTNKALAQSNDELEQFAYIASHDLKQPLNTVISFTGLLTRELATPDTTTQQFLKYMSSSSQQMKHLIEDILEYSKVNQEKKEHQVIDLNNIIEEERELLQSIIHRKQAQIIIPNPLPSIVYERTKIKLVFQNLLGNGLKYNESIPATIKVYHKIEDDFLIIAFEDNGIGIEEKYIPKLFKMFSRLENTKDYEGTGLGLSLCKKIMTNMGGHIEVNSTYGKGSTFCIKIPMTYCTTHTLAI